MRFLPLILLVCIGCGSDPEKPTRTITEFTCGEVRSDYYPETEWDVHQQVCTITTTEGATLRFVANPYSNRVALLSKIEPGRRYRLTFDLGGTQSNHMHTLVNVERID